MPKTVACPACGVAVAWLPENAWRPFCSARCKTIDLGDWASERHVIAGQSEPADVPPPDDTGQATGH